MGFHGHEAHRAAARFLRHEERTLRELTLHHGDEDRYIDAARRAITDLERVLEADRNAPDPAVDGSWDPESVRNEVRERAG
jgi:monovalent cation:H+ antiporter-2, CPA2 family